MAMSPAFGLSQKLLRLPWTELDAYLKELVQAHKYDEFRKNKDDEFRENKDPRLQKDENTRLIDVPSPPPSLIEEILREVRAEFSDEPSHRVAEHVLDDVNDLGVFYGDLDGIAVELEVPRGKVNEVFDFIREAGPIGFCSRNEQEFLSRCVQAKFPNDTKLLTLVELHALDLERGRHDLIMESMNISADELDEMLTRLGPRVLPRTARPMSCDLTVIEWGEGRGYEVYVTAEHEAKYILPEISLVGLVRRNLSDEQRKKLKELRQLVKEVKQAIKYRNLTLLRVGTELIRSQPALLENDFSRLKPLSRQDVANKLGLHLSTVSRAVMDKRIELPHGAVPLRDFFSSRVNLVKGGHTSGRAVQERILALIEGEDKRRPLTDPQIAEMLKAEGISVARTTITKYRNLFGIPSKQQRRILP